MKASRVFLSSLVVIAATAVVVSAADRPKATHRSNRAPVRAPAGGLLYDQTGSQSGNGIASQDFEGAYDAFDAMGADDFTVPAPGWSVNEVFAAGQLTGAPNTMMNISFFPDAAGFPGAVAVCTYTAVPASDDGLGNVTTALSPPCNLAPGVYWVMAQTRHDFGGGGGQWFWNGVTVPAGLPGKWQNPGGGFGTGCATWTDTTTCIPGTDRDQAFSLSGTVLAGATCNPTTIVINNAAPATPYPSTILVAGLQPQILTVTVTMNGLSHTFPADIDILLVGPGGQNYSFEGDAGGGLDVVDITYTLDDAAATQLSDTQMTSGTFRPAVYVPGNTFPPPAPPGPYNEAAPTGAFTFTSVYAGTNPNGTWSLYVVDDAGADVGQFAGGWCLEFTTVPVELQSFSVE